MAISDLIKKLQEKYELNCVYAVLQTNYNLLKKAVREREMFIPGTREHERIQRDVDELHSFLNGFLWGLRATNFLTDKSEFESLTKELRETAYSIRDSSEAEGSEWNE